MCRLAERLAAPADFSDSLRQRLGQQQQRNLHLTSAMLRIVAAFDDARISAAAYKGPMLALELYGDVGARAMSDLDFLVAPADVTRANEVLCGLGFHRAPGTEVRAPAAYEDVFVRDDGCIVELQWRLSPHYLPVSLAVEEVLQRRRRLELAGIVAPVLSGDDLLFALALHGGKHLWERLSWLADFLAFTRLHFAANDWPAVLNRARSLRVLRILLLPFALSEVLLDIKAPDAVAAAIALDPEIAPAVRAAVAALARQAPLPEAGSVAYFRQVLQLRESARDRVNGWWRLAFTPAPSDIAAASLNAPWHGFYRLIRAGRLIARFSGLSRPRSSAASD